MCEVERLREKGKEREGERGGVKVSVSKRFRE